MINPRIIEDARESVFWRTWRLHITIPSVLARDEEFSLRITTFGPEGLPSADFGREIVFGPSPGIKGLPKSVFLSREDGGHMEITGLRAIGPEYAFVTAFPEGYPLKLGIYSNPAWVLEDVPYRIFWGDLHVHTTYSNCHPWQCKDPEFCYAFAREASHLDFAAAADHLRGIAAEGARWPRLQELVRQYDAPGKFVTFLAFESSHKTGFGGDNNAYFLDGEAPYFWLDREDMKGTGPQVPLGRLWQFLDETGKEYITIPHHTARAGKYRSFAQASYSAEREPLFEIYSGWGSSECRWNTYPLQGGNTDEPAYFQDALRAGCRYGVIGSSDDHCTLPGGEKRPGLPAGPTRASAHSHAGLAAVQAHSLSRDSLWRALRSRRCYATTFGRNLLDVKIGDVEMGQAVSVGKGDPLRRKRDIRVKVLTCESPRLDIVLLRNAEEIGRKRWALEDPEVLFEDNDPLDDIAIRDAAFHPEPFVAYYVRLENRLGTQWSSPIWLDL